MCQAFTRNFVGLFASRFVLGMVEGPFLPGVFFLMSCWYKQSELPHASPSYMEQICWLVPLVAL